MNFSLLFSHPSILKSFPFQASSSSPPLYPQIPHLPTTVISRPDLYKSTGRGTHPPWYLSHLQEVSRKCPSSQTPQEYQSRTLVSSFTCNWHALQRAPHHRYKESSGPWRYPVNCCLSPVGSQPQTTYPEAVHQAYAIGPDRRFKDRRITSMGKRGGFDGVVG